MLFAFRGLFGIGMGGMWAAGMPLALEQWPAKHRGIASGILQGGYSVGFLLSSLVYQLGYPLISDRPDWAWRLMLWAGVLPGDRDLLPDDRASARVRCGSSSSVSAPARRGTPVAGAPLRSRSAMGDAPHLAADGRVRLDVPVDDVLVSDAAGN